MTIFSRFIDERQQASGGPPLTSEQKNELFGQFELWQKGQVPSSIPPSISELFV